MDQVFQALIDRSRVPVDLETIKTILGYQRRPRYRQRKSKSAQWEVAVEKATYDLTILELHCGKLTLKIYTEGERVLLPECFITYVSRRFPEVKEVRDLAASNEINYKLFEAVPDRIELGVADVVSMFRLQSKVQAGSDE